MNDLNAAIKRIETSRQTHIDWRDYWLSTPGHEDCESCKATAAIAGDLDRQVRVIAEYDNVLACLRAAESAEAAHRALQAAVEALADEWAEDYPGPTAACNRTPDEWARDLRALLAGGAR